MITVFGGGRDPQGSRSDIYLFLVTFNPVLEVDEILKEAEVRRDENRKVLEHETRYLFLVTFNPVL